MSSLDFQTFSEYRNDSTSKTVRNAEVYEKNIVSLWHGFHLVKFQLYMYYLGNFQYGSLK